MFTVILTITGVTWLGCLLLVVLDNAGRPWPGTSRGRSIGGLLICTGALVDSLNWPPLVMLLLVAAGAACVFVSHGNAPDPQAPGGLTSGTTGPAGT